MVYTSRGCRSSYSGITHSGNSQVSDSKKRDAIRGNVAYFGQPLMTASTRRLNGPYIFPFRAVVMCSPAEGFLCTVIRGSSPGTDFSTKKK